MKIAAVLALALAALIAAPEADPRYFLFVPDVQIHEGSHQNFLVLDADIFQHARADLADLRLYDGTRQVPYQLSEARARSSREEHDVPVLNLAAKGDRTEFDLDMQGVPEYDSIRFQHARADLADLRLYDGTRQVPYQLSEARARSSREEHDVPVLNLAAKGDRTEFDLDMQGVPEYDSIRLRLKAKNFVVKAWAAGRDALTGRAPVPWPTPSTLYDFSAEKLGSNFTIKLPTWSFRYVHVTLGPGIAPREVEGAFVSNQQEKQAFYMPMGSCWQVEPKPRQSIWHCDLPEKVPLDRILFAVDSQNVNFRRSVTVQDEHGGRVASGELSRIRTRRGGTDVVAEELVVPLGGICCKSATIVIENGDDAPLAIDSVQPQAFERRIYFEPSGVSALRLYFGDEKLEVPVYDYAKVFHEDIAAAQATLGASTPNPAHIPRPDDRPWSERHPSALWTAMLLAVVGLSILAIRGLMVHQA